MFLSANALAVQANTSTEIWYASNSAPTTSVTVHAAAATHFDVWVAEVADTKPGPPETVATACLQYPPELAHAPITTTVPNQLVVTVTMCAAPQFVDQAALPFTGFPQQNGNNGAYTIAAAPGTYDADYAVTGGGGMNAMTCESAATWLPGP